MLPRKPYRICRNCRHVELVKGRKGAARKDVYTCRRLPKRWIVVDGEEMCGRFAPVRVEAPEPRRSAEGREWAYLVPLPRGLHALLDWEDYRRLAGYKWTIHRAPRSCYAVRATAKMHRVILEARPGQMVDHINHNGLDNRRANLRLCTANQNGANQRAREQGSSRYKGVSWIRRFQRWRAAIGVEGKVVTLGYFKDEEEAARAYDAAARERFGEFACLNFGEEASTERIDASSSGLPV